jgi:hypothetical protein
MNLSALAFAGLVVAVMATSASAQTARDVSRDDRIPTDIPSASSRDDRIKKSLDEGQAGAVAIGVSMARSGCSGIDLLIGQLVDGKVKAGKLPMPSKPFAKQTAFGGLKAVRPGEYVVAGVVCARGSNRIRLNGPYAKFQVKAGEVVNVGLINIHYELEGVIFQTSGKLRKSVESMPADVRADLKERFPLVFPKAVERRMTLIGPAETEIRKRGL